MEGRRPETPPIFLPVPASESAKEDHGLQMVIA